MSKNIALSLLRLPVACRQAGQTGMQESQAKLGIPGQARDDSGDP